MLRLLGRPVVGQVQHLLRGLWFLQSTSWLGWVLTAVPPPPLGPFIGPLVELPPAAVLGEREGPGAPVGGAVAAAVLPGAAGVLAGALDRTKLT
eukprot:scaffold652754_cov38-Prasinocladus_malaysianus.AAC.1